MLKIGLTGSFGAGKTTVAAMFKEHGAVVIDADSVAHALMQSDRPCQRAIARAFGRDLIGRQGVDRVTLARIVFDDARALAILEKILHPRIKRKIMEAIKKAGRRMVVVDAAILVEAGWHNLVDKVIVVRAPRALQIRRVMARTGLSRADVLKRIRRQMPLREKMKYADYVVNNGAAVAITRKHVERIFRSLKPTPIQQEQVS